MFPIYNKLSAVFAGLATAALVVGLQACGGGGGGSSPAPIAPSTSTPVTSTPATATPVATATPTTAPATATPSPVPSVTPGPVTASWAGINGYLATSPPNYPLTLTAPNAAGTVGDIGPPIVFTAVGQTVQITINQPFATVPIPTLVQGGCTKSGAYFNGSTFSQGVSTAVINFTLISSIGSGNSCSLQINGQQSGQPAANIGFTVTGP